MKEKSPYVMTKVWRDTNKRLRILAAQQECTIIALIDRLAKDEEKREND